MPDEPKLVITDAMLGKLREHYNSGLEVIVNGDQVVFAGDLTKEQLANLKLDLEFYMTNPKLPLENLCNRLDNYTPRNDSQDDLLRWAHKLVDLQTPTVAAGLFIYGSTGVGKTHVAVGTTKEFMRKGLKPHYIRGDDNHRLSKVEVLLKSPQSGQVWIIDDLNSPYGFGMGVLKQVVLNAHNHGGRVFVTSNTSFKELMEHGFVTDPEEKPRFTDRITGMFKVLEVVGGSQRQRDAWYDTTFDPLDPRTYTLLQK